MPGHVPVLEGPALEWLRVRKDGVYVDCTAGAGGHSESIVRRLETGRLIALDRDAGAVERVRERLARFSSVEVVHANYGELAAVLEGMNIASVDGVLLDAGLSSVQLDDAERGFTFQADGPLDMRMDTSHGPTAAEFLSGMREPELAKVLRDFGDVGPARRIAQAITQRCARGRLKTTADLRDAVREALPFVTGDPDEIRTVFQAIRMAVNDELRWLRAGIEQAIRVLAPGGRLVAIAFHSGEDRVIKNAMRDASRPLRELHPDGRVKKTIPAQLEVLTPKPVTPDDDEVRANPRSHSARLRAAERLP
ncbi:MAG: 16S rRNA (cytosine(1402)-N(4))-methyltransferase RsmH [Candidatus Hydrogenedentes bacterium]|nr:16S rRNA (cytosine(1402)-N(4))-methyltransferase RsmH [Candidatus Hydrogenedentota bacterium]